MIKKKLLVLVLVFAFFALITNAENTNPWKLDWNMSLGISANYKNMVLNYGSRLVCVSPDFKEIYYYPAKFSFKITENSNSITIKSDVADSSVFFVEEHSVTVNSNIELTIRTKGTLKKDVPAKIQSAVFFIPEAVMQNATIVTNDSSFTVGSKPLTINKIPHKDIKFSTIYGQINLSVVNNSTGIEIQDRRATHFFNRKGFLFITNSNVRYNQTFDQKVKVTIGKDFKTFANLPEYSGKPNPFQTVPTLTEPKTVEQKNICPQPKSFTPGSGELQIPSELTASISGATAHDEKKLLEALKKSLLRAGITAHPKQQSTDGFIEVTINPSIDGKNKYDYYELNIDKKVSIVAATPAGAFYALQTLSQLIDKSNIRQASIIDYADMKMRAIQLSTVDNNALKLLLPLIEEIYAPLKINAVFLYSQNINFPSFPELHNAEKMNPEQVTELNKVCVDNYITLNPLIETYGHMEWLLENKKYKDLAEDPGKPYAYNVSNPRTFEVMEKIFDDILQIFPNLEYLHVGHDEVAHRGRYPFRPENINVPAWQLFLKNQRFCEDYAKRKKVKLMVWQDKPVHGDMSKSIFSRAWQDFAQTTNVVVWDYKDNTAFPDAELFKKHGNPTFGATGMNPREQNAHALRNIGNYARYAKKIGLDGMIHTTWSGLKNCDRTLFLFSQQYWNHVQAACAFWNVD